MLSQFAYPSFPNIYPQCGVAYSITPGPGREMPEEMVFRFFFHPRRSQTH